MGKAIEILSKAELKDITGTPVRRLQFERLQMHSWPHEVNYYGYPVVLRSMALNRLGAEPEEQTWELDTSTVM